MFAAGDTIYPPAIHATDAGAELFPDAAYLLVTDKFGLVAQEVPSYPCAWFESFGSGAVCPVPTIASVCVPLDAATA